MIKIVLINIYKVLLFKTPQEKMVNGCFLRSMGATDACKSLSVYRKVFPEKPYGILKAILLILVTRRFSICAVNEENEVIAFEFFRLAERDMRDGTIHAAYIGVDPCYGGKGVSTCLREYAKESFERNGFEGMSSRIALSNFRSLKSAEKVGFKVVDRYINGDGEDEAYLALIFND